LFPGTRPDRSHATILSLVLRNSENRCYKLASRRSKRETSNSDEMEILSPAPNVQPEETMLLEQAMLELPAEDRELITLRHLDGLSYQELAERLGVMYRLSR
jgi:RNA polymerase sigma factor (sigma-70 family)